MAIKPSLFFLFLFGFCTFLSAQQTDTEDHPLVTEPPFGRVTVDELQMKECSFEKGASAMNLVQYESVNFTVSQYGDLKLVTETTCRIKIFDKSGFKQASVIIPYIGRNRSSRIIDIEASTYNLDEKGNIVVTHINKKDIFKDKAAEKNGLSSIRFAFPDVKEGSVIEYRYTRIEKNTYFIAPWFFQSDIPTQLSACKIKLPAYTLLQKHFVALSGVEEGYHLNNADRAQFRTEERSYCMRNVPSFRAEPFMSSLKDNLQRVEFSVLPAMGIFGMIVNSSISWELLNRIFLRSSYFGQQFKAPIPGADQFIDSLKQCDSLCDKINAVYQYVKQHINWDKHYSFYADNLADVWKEKQGNSAEINLSILNLLRKANIDCYPILFSTRQNGKVDLDFPNASQFNSVDVLVVNRDTIYVLDGVEANLSFRVRPLSILNRNALIIDKEDSKWVHIDEDKFLMRDSVSVMATLHDDGSVTGEAVITYFDLSRAGKIEDDNHKEEDDDENYYLLNDAPDIKIDTSYLLNKESELLPLQQVMKFHYELPSSGDFYFLNPFLFSTFRKNPFTDTTRQSDIDFGANSSFLVHMEIALPEKVKIEELARNKVIRTPDSALFFNRHNELKENKLVLNSSFNIAQAVFDKEDYHVVANFFKTVYQILNDQILFKRKDE